MCFFFPKDRRQFQIIYYLWIGHMFKLNWWLLLNKIYSTLLCLLYYCYCQQSVAQPKFRNFVEWFQDKLWVRKFYINFLDICCSISRTNTSEWCSFKWQFHCEEINRTYSYMKIHCKFLAILFKVLLSYSKYFIFSKTEGTLIGYCFLLHGNSLKMWIHTKYCTAAQTKSSAGWSRKEGKTKGRFMSVHSHKYHGHYREPGKKFKTWSFTAKHLCLLLPVLNLNQQREFRKLFCSSLSLGPHAASTTASHSKPECW